MACARAGDCVQEVCMHLLGILSKYLAYWLRVSVLQKIANADK
jgi:hypothetical protein